METPYVVITSSQKAAGKTLLAFNLAAALWHDGYSVKICSPFAENFLRRREEFCRVNKFELPFPESVALTDLDDKCQKTEEKQVAVIDMQNADNEKNEMLLAKAHTLITVVNPKDDETNWQADSPYLNLIWRVKKEAAQRGRKYLNWIVAENQIVPHLESSKALLEKFSRRYGFRVAPIVRYRKTYQHIMDGYCAADMPDFSGDLKMTMADVYARREILKLTDFMWQRK